MPTSPKSAITIYRRRGDTHPPLLLGLYEEVDGASSLMNLAAFPTRVLRVRPETAPRDAAEEWSLVSHVDENGVYNARHDLLASDTSAAGRYVLEAELTSVEGDVVTVPTEGVLVLVVGEDVG